MPTRTLDTKRLPDGAVLIVGAGLAGLYLALKLAPRPVYVLTSRRSSVGAASAWAQGGIAAKLAVQELISVFKASPEFSQAADLEVADSLSQDYKGKPLDKAGYNSELRKLIAAGHSYESSPEIKALNKRRMQSRNRGI